MLLKLIKKRIKIALVVLNAVRNTFLETSEFIGSALKEECEKERMTASKLSKKIS